MIPERTAEANAAKSVFFEDVNDIDIYIEDTAFGYEKLYTILFSRIFRDTYKVNQVFALGGRKAVIEQHNAHDSERPSLYVIDGDLFLLTGDNVHNTKGLYKLPYYCIENILCDFSSLLTIMDEEEPIRNLDSLHASFGYLDWVENNEDKLFSLFVEYATSMLLNPQEQTVAYKVSDLVSCSRGEIDNAKLQTRISQLRELTTLKSSEEQYKEARGKILQNFTEARAEKLSVISGKDYLFPLLKMRAKSVVKTKISDLNFKMRLARTCNIEPIADAINHVIV